MGDIAPNTELIRRRLKLKKSELAVSMERLDLRKLEILDEVKKIDDNINLTRQAIEELDIELKKS